MNFGNSNKQIIINQLVWIGISFGISITISMLVPFPVSLLAIFGVFIMLNLYMRRITIKRMGGIVGGATFGSMFGSNQNTLLKYYCIGCGTQHRHIACPNCGSKMKRVGA
jgi:cell shape-determining protein MreD